MIENKTILPYSLKTNYFGIYYFTNVLQLYSKSFLPKLTKMKVVQGVMFF